MCVLLVRMWLFRCIGTMYVLPPPLHASRATPPPLHASHAPSPPSCAPPPPFRERYSKPSWFPEVPPHAKLTESDIDCFVKCLLPTVQLAMFNKMTALYAASTFHNLALIRSDLVLPPLLERLCLFRGRGAGRGHVCVFIVVCLYCAFIIYLSSCAI